MKKYFKKEQPKKVVLADYLAKVEKDYKDIQAEKKKHSTGGYVADNVYSLLQELEIAERNMSSKYVRIKHIYKSLGEVKISEEMIETICKSFDDDKCRYGSICLRSQTVKDLYDISELFPELSEEALIAISREYIKDLFDKHSLLDTLSMMLRKDGQEDTTFEKFMDKVKKLADQEDIKYANEAWHFRMYYGQYSYDFVRHFEKFIKQHHITCEQLGASLPDPELFMDDILLLKDISLRAKDCWSVCKPISFQMLEDYLDGDVDLFDYDEQPEYYISIMRRSFPTSFTKTEFLERIKKQQIILKRQ